MDRTIHPLLETAVNFDCCYKCERRHIGCHTDCKDYLETKAKDKEKRQSMKRARASAFVLDGLKCDGRRKAGKHKHLKK